MASKPKLPPISDSVPPSHPDAQLLAQFGSPAKWNQDPPYEPMIEVEALKEHGAKLREEFESEKLKDDLVALSEKMKYADDRIFTLTNSIQSATRREDEPIWLKKFAKPFAIARAGMMETKVHVEDITSEKANLQHDLESPDLWTKPDFDDDVQDYFQDPDQEDRSFQIHIQIQGLDQELDVITDEVEEFSKVLSDIEADYRNNLADKRMQDKKTRKELVEELNELKTVYAYSATDVAQKAGIDPKKMRRYLTGETKLTGQDLDKIAAIGPAWGDVAHSLVDQQLVNPSWNEQLNNILKTVERDALEAGDNYLKPSEPAIPLGHCPQCKSDEWVRVEKSVKLNNDSTFTTFVETERFKRCGELEKLKDAEGNVIMAPDGKPTTAYLSGCGHGWRTWEVSKDNLIPLLESDRNYQTLAKEVADLKETIANSRDGTAETLFEDFLEPAPIVNPITVVHTGFDDRQDDTIEDRRAYYKELSESGSGITSINLVTLEPEVAALWYHEANDAPPEAFHPRSTYKAWWKCEEGHEYQARIRTQTDGRGCPVCKMETNQTIKHFHNAIRVAADTANQAKELVAKAKANPADPDVKKQKKEVSAKLDKALTDVKAAGNAAKDTVERKQGKLKEELMFEELKRLKMLHEKGLITDNVWEQRQQAALDKEDAE